MTRIVNPGWMIFSTPHNQLLGPAQITGHGRFNGIHYPFMKILIALVQASGEDMILSAIQLLRVALLTRLLLLIALMIIATLVILITLIVMSTLITVEARTGISSTITPPMRPGARTASWSIIIPERIRIFELLHDVTIFPEVRGRVLLCPMLWTGLVQ